jgi:hypothetical protein
MPWPVFESRLPVGSSASRSAGRFAERARHSNALHFATGQLIRFVMGAGGQAYGFQQLKSALATLSSV